MDMRRTRRGQQHTGCPFRAPWIEREASSASSSTHPGPTYHLLHSCSIHHHRAWGIGTICCPSWKSYDGQKKIWHASCQANHLAAFATQGGAVPIHESGYYDNRRPERSPTRSRLLALIEQLREPKGPSRSPAPPERIERCTMSGIPPESGSSRRGSPR